MFLNTKSKSFLWISSKLSACPLSPNPVTSVLQLTLFPKSWMPWAALKFNRLIYLQERSKSFSNCFKSNPLSINFYSLLSSSIYCLKLIIIWVPIGFVSTSLSPSYAKLFLNLNWSRLRNPVALPPTVSHGPLTVYPPWILAPTLSNWLSIPCIKSWATFYLVSLSSLWGSVRITRKWSISTTPMENKSDKTLAAVILPWRMGSSTKG